MGLQSKIFSDVPLAQRAPRLGLEPSKEAHLVESVLTADHIKRLCIFEEARTDQTLVFNRIILVLFCLEVIIIILVVLSSREKCAAIRRRPSTRLQLRLQV